MKKLLLALGLMGALSAPGLYAAHDGLVDIVAGPGRIGTGGGGPFQLTASSPQTTAMNQIIGQGNPFLSFCLEKTETIDLSGTQKYRAVVSQQAVNGGSLAFGGPNPDPISLATAWLYSTFRANGTTGLDATFIANESGANDVEKINKGRDSLQQAIWYLEHEQGSLLAQDSYLLNAAIAGVNAYYGSVILTLANVRDENANGAFGVRVLNLYSSDGVHLKQDQLAIVPEPSTYIAGALLLLPLLVQVRRWKRSV